VRDLAFGLLRRGHTPVVYSTELGEVAKEIREATIPVVDDLAAVSTPPDVIHGHHYHETMTALLRFPSVPAVYVCHDWYSRLDAPPKFPRILRYVAVDQACYDKLIYETAIPEERVRLLLNFVVWNVSNLAPHSRRARSAHSFSTPKRTRTLPPRARRALAQGSRSTPWARAPLQALRAARDGLGRIRHRVGKRAHGARSARHRYSRHTLPQEGHRADGDGG
jgi:hypothetical protein